MRYPEEMETARLHLVRWDATREADAYAEICADAEVMRFLGGPAPPELALDHARVLEADWELHGYGVWAAYPVAGGGLLGYVGLAGADWLPGWEHAVEVGWRLRRDAWGQGYATEGARAAIAAAPALGLRAVHSFIDPANTASVRVAEKLDLAPVDTTTHPRREQTLTVFRRDLHVDLDLNRREP